MTFLASFAAWLLKTIGITGCALLALWTYEEGIPFADRLVIPKSVWIVGGLGIGDIPVIGQLTTGHVQTYAADQVKIATAADKADCDARVQKLVTGYETTALKAQLAAQAESQRQAALVTSEYERRLSAFHAVNDQKDKDLDDALAANEKLRAAAGLSCPPDDGTRKLLREHGFQVDQ